MEALIQFLKNEEKLLNQIKTLLSNYEQAAFSKNLDLMNMLLAELEKVINEFEAVEEQRKSVFEKVKASMNLPVELTFYNYASSNEELMKDLFAVVKLMNEISLLIDRLKSILDFNLNYIETLVFVLNPPEGSAYDKRANVYKSTTKSNIELQG